MGPDKLSKLVERSTALVTAIGLLLAVGAGVLRSRRACQASRAPATLGYRRALIRSSFPPEN